MFSLKVVFDVWKPTYIMLVIEICKECTSCIRINRNILTNNISNKTIVDHVLLNRSSSQYKKCMTTILLIVVFWLLFNM